MPIDPQKLNTIYNQLKELVGHQGAFALFCSSGTDGTDEDTQIRMFGPQTRQIGLLDSCGPFIRENLIQEFNSRIKKLPQEPD